MQLLLPDEGIPRVAARLPQGMPALQLLAYPLQLFQLLLRFAKPPLELLPLLCRANLRPTLSSPLQTGDGRARSQRQLPRLAVQLLYLWGRHGGRGSLWSFVRGFSMRPVPDRLDVFAGDERRRYSKLKMELAVEDAKELVAELCAGLYTQGHVSGTGGGISIRAGDRAYR